MRLAPARTAAATGADAVDYADVEADTRRQVRSTPGWSRCRREAPAMLLVVCGLHCMPQMKPSTVQVLIAGTEDFDTQPAV